MILWAAYWWRERNCADMFANAARQLVCRYLSLVLVILYWMVLITTRIRRLPREISVKTLSEYQVMFFNITS